MGRAPCCDKVGLKKGPWTPEEDQKLVSYIQEHGHGSWRALPQNAGLLRCGKSCRLRWTNYLRPDIKRGNFNVQEEQTIIQLHALLGNRWSTIAQHLPKRTDNEIKNYWNTHLKKRLSKMGIDPVTHKPKSDSMNVLDGHSRSSSALSHMAQWESARLEAEVRLARQSRLGNKGLFSIHGNVSSHASLFQNNDTWKKEPLSLHVTTRSRCLDVLNAKLLSSGATNTNSCLTVSTNSTHLMESPTSSLTFVDGAYNRQSSDTSGDTNTNYLSMLQTKQQPESSPFQIPVASSPLENKPSREDLSRFLLGTDNNGDQSSNPGEHGLLFPGLHDMMLFPSDHHCSSTPSVSSPEEQSPANDMSNHGDDTTNFEGCFNEDLLLDLDDAPNCELAECPEPEEEPHKSIMHRDYWNNILNMVNSPGGHNSSVPSIF